MIGLSYYWSIFELIVFKLCCSNKLAHQKPYFKLNIYRYAVLRPSIELIERNNQTSVKVYQYSPRCKHVSASWFFFYTSLAKTRKITTFCKHTSSKKKTTHFFKNRQFHARLPM